MHDDVDPDRIGQVLLGKLRVIRLLGEGGMGAVYEVEHLHTRHRRALKLLPSTLARPEQVTRFLRQASVAGTAKSPHIVETFDAGRLEDGTPYVLMEKLEGETLGERIEREKMLGAATTADLMRQAADGLSAAHAVGVVHRDLKPDNIFLQDVDGSTVVKLLDFGISKFADGWDDSATLTRDGSLMGTPYYMAPEQAMSAKDVDARADVYSLGVILYELISGSRPYEADNISQLVFKLQAGNHPSLTERAPEVDPGLCQVIEKAMSRAPIERFQSAAELSEALAAYCAGGHAAPGTKTSSRRQSPVLPAVLVIGVGAAASAWAFAPLPQSPASAEPPQAAVPLQIGFDTALASYVGADNVGCLTALDGADGDTERGSTLRAACLFGAERVGEADEAVRGLWAAEQIEGVVLGRTTPEFRAFVAERQPVEEPAEVDAGSLAAPSVAQQPPSERPDRPSVNAMLDLDPYEDSQ